MEENKKLFYMVDSDYAIAYIEDDQVFFDVGQFHRGVLCGGSIIRKFPRSYTQDKTFEDFLIDLDTVDMITNVLGEERAQKKLDEMWKYLCDANC